MSGFLVYLFSCRFLLSLYPGGLRSWFFDNKKKKHFRVEVVGGASAPNVANKLYRKAHVGEPTNFKQKTLERKGLEKPHGGLETLILPIRRPGRPCG